MVYLSLEQERKDDVPLKYWRTSADHRGAGSYRVLVVICSKVWRETEVLCLTVKIKRITQKNILNKALIFVFLKKKT